MNRLFVGSLLNPINLDHAELIMNGTLETDENGRIVQSGPQNIISSPMSGVTHDFSGCLILPGFIDCHAHIAQVRAVNVRYSELLKWLERVVFPLEIHYGRKEAAAEAPRFFGHLLRTGTTTSALYVTISEEATDEVFAVAERMGVRAIIGKVMMDQHSPDGLREDTAASVDASIRLCEKWHGRDLNRLRYAFTPRFALTSTMDLMKKAGEAAKLYGAHVMTHVSENRAETRRAAELFPQCGSYLKIYQEAGLLMPGSILGHAIYLSDDDWDNVKSAGAGLAHCPISNLMLESGILDLSLPLSRGIGVGLGSDIGAGAEPALAEVAESAITSQIARKVLGHPHRLISPESALYMMTKGGANAIGLGHMIGDLSPGKEADLLVLDPRPCLPLGEWKADLAPASLLYSILFHFRPEAVKAVFVQGKKVYPTDGHE